MEDCWMFFPHANRRWDCFNLVALLMDLDQTEQVPALLRHSFKLVLVEEQRVIFKHPESSGGGEVAGSRHRSQITGWAPAWILQDFTVCDHPSTLFSCDLQWACIVN